MNSREAILQAVRHRKPAPVPLPDDIAFGEPDGDLIARFMEEVVLIGGRAIETTLDGAASMLEALYPDRETTASTVAHITGNVSLSDVQDPHDLNRLDLLVCSGTLGVAENGAVWLPESELIHRVAPFLTQHLAVLLDRDRIVWNMHEAYRRLHVDTEGFGVFVAGPSKTADIEQSLVIGAHGSRSLTVMLVELPRSTPRESDERESPRPTADGGTGSTPFRGYL